MAACLTFGGLLVFLLTAQAAVFYKVDPKPLNVAQSATCAAKVLKTIVAASAIRCGVACGLDSRCYAFLHNKQDRSCSLLTSRWMSLPSKEHVLFQRRDLQWRFDESEYVVTEETGDWNTMKKACVDRGMHLWYPNSNEEMRFVEQEILCNLPEELFNIPSWSRDKKIVIYKVWFGVSGTSDKTCLLADGVTMCPVTNWAPGEPGVAISAVEFVKKITE